MAVTKMVLPSPHSTTSVGWQEARPGFLESLFSHCLTMTNDHCPLNDGTEKPGCFQIALYLSFLKYSLSLVCDELSDYITLPPHTAQIQQN